MTSNKAPDSGELGPVDGTVAAPAPRRLLYGDGMRVVATAAVMLIHTFPNPRFLPPSSSLIAPACLANTATRWCVPVFFMLSGALLLDPARHESAGEFYRKRLGRVGVPLAFWSAFYLCWRYAVTGTLVGAKAAIHDLIRGSPEKHLWFAFSILGLYLITPSLRPFISASRRLDQWRLAIICLGLSSTACVFWTVQGSIGWMVPPEPVFTIEWAFYLGYFLLGFLIRDIKLSRLGLLEAAAVFLVASCLSWVGLMVADARGQGWRGEGLFMCYLNPLVILSSVPAFFLIAAGFRAHHPGYLRPLGAASFGVYLSHVAVLDTLKKLGWLRSVGESTASYVGLWSAAILISFAISIFLIRIPGLRKIVGA